MGEQDRKRHSEDNAAGDAKRDRSPRERNPYTEWLREQMGETRRANRSESDAGLDPYGRPTR